MENQSATRGRRLRPTRRFTFLIIIAAAAFGWWAGKHAVGLFLPVAALAGIFAGAVLFGLGDDRGSVDVLDVPPPAPRSDTPEPAPASTQKLRHW